jgi:hypothetical protein
MTETRNDTTSAECQTLMLWRPTCDISDCRLNAIKRYCADMLKHNLKTVMLAEVLSITLHMVYEICTTIAAQLLRLEVKALQPR